MKCLKKGQERNKFAKFFRLKKRKVHIVLRNRMLFIKISSLENSGKSCAEIYENEKSANYIFLTLLTGAWPA
jgi:hypothetical protein